jgi:hypothetical protein
VFSDTPPEDTRSTAPPKIRHLPTFRQIFAKRRRHRRCHFPRRDDADLASTFSEKADRPSTDPE